MSRAGENSQKCQMCVELEASKSEMAFGCGTAVRSSSAVGEDVKDEDIWEGWPSVKEDALSADLCCFSDSDDVGCCVGVGGVDGLISGGVTVTEKSVCSQLDITRGSEQENFI
jgi:hypothetical protein